MIGFPQMTHDIPPKIIKEYSAEVRFIENVENDVANNDYAGHAPFELPGLGGYISLGTTNASGASLSIVPSYSIKFTPVEGPIPYYELQQHHLAQTLENLQEIIKKK